MIQIGGEAYLLLALLIFSSAGSVFTKLNNYDEDIFMPCNVLCSSNMVGAVLLSIFFREEVTVKNLESISKENWMWMVLGSVLYSVVGPFLYLTGLASTDVPTAAITQRMESLNFLFLSYIFLGASISSWTMVNASLTLCGIILAVISPVFWGDSVKVSTGALFILLSGYAFSSSLLISKKYLSKISVGVLAVFRVLLGSVLYHFLVLALGENLGNLYSSKLWIAMAPYGFVYVFGGQICWLLALQKASPISISMGTTFLFVLTLCWSAALLGVLPTTAQWIGSAFLVTSILSSVVEVRYKALESAQESAIKGELEEPLPIAAHTTTNSNPIHATAGDVSYKRSQS